MTSGLNESLLPPLRCYRLSISAATVPVVVPTVIQSALSSAPRPMLVLSIVLT